MSDELKTEELSQEGDLANTGAEETPEEVNELTSGLASGEGEDFKWYIAKTLTGQENKISKSLKERIVNYKLTEYFADILVPEEDCCF